MKDCPINFSFIYAILSNLYLINKEKRQLPILISNMNTHLNMHLLIILHYNIRLLVITSWILWKISRRLKYGENIILRCIFWDRNPFWNNISICLIHYSIILHTLHDITEYFTWYIAIKILKENFNPVCICFSIIIIV